MSLQPPASLVSCLKEKRCVLFVGAGLSAAAKLPNWRELLERLIAKTILENPKNAIQETELKQLLIGGKFLEVADHCKERLGPQFIPTLIELLRPEHIRIPELHRIIVRLPFSAWITTNYDKLLEQAYFEVQGAWPKTLTHLDSDVLGTLLFDGAPFILKAHGDIDSPKSLVLTTRDYRENIHSNAAFNAVFSAILLTKAICFVGYSISDPDFRLLLDRQLTTFKDYIPDRYALMSGIGDVEQEVLWRTARIKVIAYPQGEHQQLTYFFERLVNDIKVPSEAASYVESRPAVTEVVAPTFFRSTESHAVLDVSLSEDGDHINAGLRSGDLAELGSGPHVPWGSIIRMFGRAPEELSLKIYSAIGWQLASVLPDGVLSALTQLISRGIDSLALRVGSELEALPWELLNLNDKHLAMSVPVVREPVSTSTLARGYPAIRRPIRALLIGDPGNNLPGARTEVDKIAALYEKSNDAECMLLLGSNASAERLQQELSSGRHDIVHFAGHASYESHEVYLLLNDNIAFPTILLRRALSQRSPAVLMLNSHFTAFIPLGARTQSKPDAKEIKVVATARTGFLDLATISGVGAFVGTFGSPSDFGAADLAVNFHRNILAGSSVARALYDARLAISALRKDDPTYLLYVLSGYGSLVMKR